MERRSDIRPEQAMEEAFRIPLFATLVFVIMMAAIFFLGRNVSAYYSPVITGQVTDAVSSS